MPSDDVPPTTSSPTTTDAPATAKHESSSGRTIERWKPFRQRNLTLEQRKVLADTIRWSRRQRFGGEPEMLPYRQQNMQPEERKALADQIRKFRREREARRRLEKDTQAPSAKE
jgi:hypothetical protein